MNAADAPFRILVFSKTAGFRHDAIPAGITALRELGAANDFTVDATEDAGAFTTANLSGYQAIVFLLTTGDVLNAAQQTAFESYITAGGGYAGVHAAADTEYDWPFYGGLVGAYFASHPAIQQATIRVEDRAHPSTAHLPAAWQRTDELYNYRTNPRGTVHVLATLDESTYTGGSMGGDHPIAWCQAYRGGRSWYTGLGHTIESYSEPAFRAHLLGGVRYAAGAVAADCSAPPPPSSPTVEAEGFSAQSGTQIVTKASAHGGRAVGYIDNGDWLGFAPVESAQARGFTARVASAGAGGTIQVRAGSPTGALLGSAQVPVTGGWETWQNVSTTLTGTGSGPLHLVFTGGAGSLFDLDDFTVTRDSTPPPASGLLSANRPVTASSTEDAGFPASAVVDGNAGTRWSSAFSDPQWISIDLGSTRSVNRVVLQWEAAYGRAYRIETSTNGTTWTSAHSTTTGDGATDDITLAPVSARYVRMYGTQRATPYGYSLWEMEVHGT
nr:ThuA domain-containing protein [Actinomadura alba]